MLYYCAIVFFCLILHPNTLVLKDSARIKI